VVNEHHLKAAGALGCERRTQLLQLAETAQADVSQDRQKGATSMLNMQITAMTHHLTAAATLGLERRTQLVHTALA
jgi:hypothetical protein